MFYYVTKFNSNELNSGTQLFFRTNDLQQWLEAIIHVRDKYNIKENLCLYQKQVRQDGSEHTFFTFFDNTYNKENYKKLPFCKKPEFIFDGFPEGVKYVQVEHKN